MAVGVAQIAVVLLLIQRALEELHARRNGRRLLAQGGYEIGAAFYPVVVVSHLGWIAALFVLIPADAPVDWRLIMVYLALQAPRYWVIATLGPYWTTKIINLDSAPAVTAGPFRFCRHPNYLVLMLETLVLPLAFGAWQLALAFGVITALVLGYKIRLEDRALAGRRGGSQAS